MGWLSDESHANLTGAVNPARTALAHPGAYVRASREGGALEPGSDQYLELARDVLKACTELSPAG
jgi:hypothetical protein